MDKLSDRQQRLVASFRKTIAYTLPELQDDALDQFIDELLSVERRRAAGLLEEVLVKGGNTDWRSRLLAVADRLTKGVL